MSKRARPVDDAPPEKPLTQQPAEGDDGDDDDEVELAEGEVEYRGDDDDEVPEAEPSAKRTKLAAES